MFVPFARGRDGCWRYSRHGFTLVELLVVVTIILVLLAMLIPATNKALYQAQLVRCATNYRFLANASQNYALDHRRHYPFRDLPNPPDGAGWPLAVQAHKLTHPTTGSGSLAGYDIRPMLRPYVKINDLFNDPLCVPVDYDNAMATAASTSLYTSVFYWSGWYFRDANRDFAPMRGMFRLGDRFTAYDEYDTNPKRTVSLSILAGDIDCAGGNAWSSHPDFGAMRNQVIESEMAVESNWVKGGANRLPLDLNFAYDDGSVRRVDQVRWYGRHASPKNNDERMVRIANMNNQSGIDTQANNVPLN